MSTTADAYGPVIACVLSSGPPTGAVEAAMQQVVLGSQPTEAEGRYFAAFQELWQRATANQDLAGRVHQCVGLHVLIVSRFTQAEAAVGLKNPQAMKAAFARSNQAAEAEVLSALVADPDKGVRIWQGVVEKDRGYIEKSDALISFTQRVGRALLASLAKRAATGAVKRSGMSSGELVRIADLQVRAVVLENREMFVDAALAGVSAWSMPIVDADRTAVQLSLGSGLTGGIGSVVTTVASLEVAGLAVGTATVLSVTGVGLLVVGMGLGIAAYAESIEGADDSVDQQRLEAAIKTETIKAFSSVADGITLVQDVLVMVCAADAMTAGIDVRSAERDSLRRFIWGRMFPAITTPTLVAATAYVTATMNQRLNPRIVGA